MFKKLTLSFITLLISTASFSALCPDGSYVSGTTCTLCPDGSYVSGSSCVLQPDGTYTGK